MSNYDLKSEVSRLTSELRNIEHDNNQLRSEISSAVSSVTRAERDLQEYNKYVVNTLENVNETIKDSINRSITAYNIQGEIDQLYVRYKNVELANKKIRALNNKKYYDFNNYRTVRKIVQAMMDNFDLNMVSDELIYKSIEKQHLKTPDYWLTPALLSIMAWKNDDQLLAEKAIEEAVKLDKKSACIFYMIFNMRMKRELAAVKWFLEYQKCDLKGNDDRTFLMLFSLISKTLIDTVDADTVNLIDEYLHRIIIECAEKEGYSEEELVNSIKSKMLQLVKVESYDLANLSKYCKDYNQISKMLNYVDNNYNILEFIMKIKNVPITEKNTYLKEYLNEFIAQPNNVEIGIYNEIEYNEMIIKMGGEVEHAKERFEAELNRRETDLNIISSIIGWIYDFGNDNIDGQMRLNMFTLIKSLYLKATNSYFENYRAMNKNVHPVEIFDYSSDVNFNTQEGENKKVELFYEDKQNSIIKQVKYNTAYLAFAIAAVCGIAAPFTSLYLLLVTVIGAVIGVGIMISNKYKKKNIILSIQKDQDNVLEILQKLFIEYSTVKDMYKERDEISERILLELSQL